MIGLSPRTIANWRSNGRGPKYLKLGPEPPAGKPGQAPGAYERDVAERGPQHTSTRGRWRDEKRNVRSGDTVQKPPKHQKRWEGTRRHRQADPHPAGMDVDAFIHDNRRLIERLRKGTR